MQPCPRILEDIDAPRKPVQKSINWSLRLTKRFHLHERLKSTEKLKRLFSPRLAIRRHGNWLDATCSRLNYSNETTNTVVKLERVRPKCERPVRLQQGSKRRTPNTHADWFSRKSSNGIFARRMAFTARIRPKWGDPSLEERERYLDECHA